MTALFLLLWVGAAFFVLRLLGRRYFHEPRRADVAALGIAVAFALGVLWPYSARVGIQVSSTPVHPVAVTRSNAVAPHRPPPYARDTTAACRYVKTSLPTRYGAIDVFFSWEQPSVPVVEGGQMDRRDHYSLLGWATDPTGDRPASGVCLVVDGKVDTRAKVYYGTSRPDVAAALHSKQLVFSGYLIDLAPDSLTPGAHLIQVAARSATGELGVMPPERNVTVH